MDLLQHVWMVSLRFSICFDLALIKLSTVISQGNITSGLHQGFLGCWSSFKGYLQLNQRRRLQGMVSLICGISMWVLSLYNKYLFPNLWKGNNMVIQQCKGKKSITLSENNCRRFSQETCCFKHFVKLRRKYCRCD